MAQVQKTAFVFEGDCVGNSPNVCDTISHEGKLWLVPEWFHNQETGKSKPVRMICLDFLEHQKSDGLRYHYVLNKPIPPTAFDGQRQPPSKGIFLIVEHPDIEVDTQEILRQQN